MIALIQRARSAKVEVEGVTVGAIGQGVLALVGVEGGDTHRQAERLLDRLLGYRIFADAEGKMNLNVSDVQGGLLLVPQFTLAADTAKGMRPSFSRAASPQRGRELFDFLVVRARQRYSCVETGQFGAHMQVHSINDGPVTFWLRAPVSAD